MATDSVSPATRTCSACGHAMDDPSRLGQLLTVSGLHDQRFATLAQALEETQATLAAAQRRVHELEARVLHLETLLRPNHKRRS